METFDVGGSAVPDIKMSELWEGKTHVRYMPYSAVAMLSKLVLLPQGTVSRQV